MLALSTAYFTLHDRELPGRDLAGIALDLGFAALELDYRLSAAQLRGLRPHLVRGELVAVSVHHPFPRPPEVSPREAHEERVRLSAPDPGERREALRRAVETLAHAEDLGIPCCVLHLGEVALPEGPDPRDLARIVREGRRESPAYAVLRDQVAKARQDAAAPFVEAALSSLDRLASEALRRGVRLGLENRYHPHQLPSREELSAVFRELDGAPLGYWHDTGHARSLALLGFLESETALLEDHQGRLLGLHLHDAWGLDDHLAPGAGDLDFAAVAPWVGLAPLVLEVHPPASREVVRGARQVLAAAGFPV